MLASPDNPLLPVIPYASLTDHTLPITSLHLSFGSFPRTRILTGSLDGTLKLWDLTLARSKSSTLLSTFSVGSSNEQITHVAMDSLERTVFVACREPKGGRSRVVRVDLYRRLRRGETQQEEEGEGDNDDEDAEAEEETDRWEALGGGGRGDIVRLNDSGQKAPSSSSSSSSNNNQTKASEATQQVGTLSVPGRTYVLPSSPPAESSISSLHLSPLSSTLVLGTSSGQIHVLSLPSMQPIRMIVPLAGSTSISPGAQTLNLVKSFLRPVDLVSRSGGGAGAGKEEQIQPRAVAGQLSRTILQSTGNSGSAVVMIRLNGVSDGRGEVEDLIDPPTWSSIGTSTLQAAYSQTPSMTLASDATSGSNNDNNGSGHQNLQEENARLREQLTRSIALNERIWEGVVDGVLGHRGGPASSALSAAPPGKSQHGGMEMEV